MKSMGLRRLKELLSHLFSLILDMLGFIRIKGHLWLNDFIVSYLGLLVVI